MKDTPVVLAMGFDPETHLRGIGRALIQKHHKYPKDRETGEKIHYANLITAFDIEVSTYDDPEEGPQGFMYIWQWQFGSVCTVFGRTWDEFLTVAGKLNAWLDSQKLRLMVYVHNLAFEFQYLAGIWEFKGGDIFATDVRSPLRVKMDRLELRCSYRLSGMSLETWAKELKTDHQKVEGFDYSVMRYPWTGLTDLEYKYCFNDVVCVVECIEKQLEAYGDTLYTIPMTKTAYVRRRVKQAMYYWSATGIQGMQNDIRTYDRLREAFRGGDTHANRYWVESILGDVYSYDRSSSYPDVIVHCKFPMSKFREEKASFEEFKKLCESGRACLAKVAFYKIKLEDTETGNPYLSYEHCSRPGYTRPIGEVMDNGRIMSADYCEMALTEIDYRIIETQYDWESVRVIWLMSARYGFLPQPLIDVILNLYRDKTALKGVEGRELNYAYAKADLNSVYGMMCQRVISQPIVFENGNWNPGEFRNKEGEKISREEAYAIAIDGAFLNYAWAVWVTAWARWRLFEGIEIATKESRLNFVYADTDSIKARSAINLDKYNAARIRDAKASGAFADDSKGIRHYMGVFEYEGMYDQFVTLGAKRYCSKEGDNITITVAGVPKKEGAEELKRKGGIEAFVNGFIFSDSGKTAAVYNDASDYWVEFEGIPVHITRNVCIVPTTYDLSLESNYALLIATLQDTIDAWHKTDYNRKR